jgi:hypothetical protein
VRLFHILIPAVLALACFAEPSKTVETPATTVQGKLIQHEYQAPVIETANHKLVTLDGDGSTVHVLNDKRIAGMEIEAKGHFTAADHFQIEPFHTHAIHVLKDGKRLLVTYWCDVCSIRQYEPGPCWCCQRETALALKSEDE